MLEVLYRCVSGVILLCGCCCILCGVVILLCGVVILLYEYEKLMFLSPVVSWLSAKG